MQSNDSGGQTWGKIKAMKCYWHSLALKTQSNYPKSTFFFYLMLPSLTTRVVGLHQSLYSKKSKRLNHVILSCTYSTVHQWKLTNIHWAKKLIQEKRYYSLKTKLENIYTIPNALTLSRILVTPWIGFSIVQLDYTTSIALLSYAGFTDLLDGYLARRWNQKTAFGSALDPMADKILMTTLCAALMQIGSLPLWLGGLIIGRDIGLVLGTAYKRYQSLAPPKTWSRYFNVSLPTAEVQPPLISKWNTVFQLLLMGCSLAGTMYGFNAHWLMDGLRGLVAVTTVWSGLHYLLRRDTVKFC